MTEDFDLFSIKGKVVIITGAGNGIGKHIAKKMAEQSAYVYCISKLFENDIPKDLTNNLFNIKCNVKNKRKFQKICDEVFIKHKKIDVLINNAGVTYPQKEKSVYPLNKWLSTLEINLTAAFNCSQHVIKHMVKNKQGSIINITSINAELGFPNNPAYVASKGGLKMLGKALARDWGKFGIRVNSIGPGYIKTDPKKSSYKDLRKRVIRRKHTMLDRWGEPNDLVGPCIFFASNASKFITGQDLYVDGGWTANGLIE